MAAGGMRRDPGIATHPLCRYGVYEKIVPALLAPPNEAVP
jgi:hypothetical protein